MSTAAMIQLDRDGHILQWSDAAEQAFGFSARDTSGEHYSLLFSYDDRVDRRPERVLARAAHDGRCEEEILLVRKGGQAARHRVRLDARREGDALVGYEIALDPVTNPASAPRPRTERAE